MVQKELSLLILIFLFLALGMHFGAWIDHPMTHIKSLSSSSLGRWHPLFITLVVYIFILVIRVLIYFVKKIKD